MSFGAKQEVSSFSLIPIHQADWAVNPDALHLLVASNQLYLTCTLSLQFGLYPIC